MIVYKLTTVFFLFSFLSFADVEVEGEQFPSELTFGNKKLIFNGGGVREKFNLDLYVAALYLPSKMNSRTAIYANKNSIAIKLKIVSSLITPEKMEAAIEEGFDSSFGKNKANYRKEIDALKAPFKNGIVIGDKFDFVFVEGKGVSVYKNGVEKVSVNKLGFKEGVFDIWIGAKPVQEDLKEDLLGIE